MSKKHIKEIEISWQGVKREALIRLEWRKSVHSCVGLRQPGTAVSC